jgi:CheY-like chemotaxis protein
MAPFEPLSPAVILVVEDDRLVQLELADWLGALGLTVLTADNADDALALLDARADVEILLTDIQMPGSMDGIRLAHRVAERRPAIRILVMSGLYATELSVLPAGSRFFPKPIDHEKLWRALAPQPDAPVAPIAPPARHRPPPRSGCA